MTTERLHLQAWKCPHSASLEPAQPVWLFAKDASGGEAIEPFFVSDAAEISRALGASALPSSSV